MLEELRVIDYINRHNELVKFDTKYKGSIAKQNANEERKVNRYDSKFQQNFESNNVPRSNDSVYSFGNKRSNNNQNSIGSTNNIFGCSKQPFGESSTSCNKESNSYNPFEKRSNPSNPFNKSASVIRTGRFGGNETDTSIFGRDNDNSNSKIQNNFNFRSKNSSSMFGISNNKPKNSFEEKKTNIFGGNSTSNFPNKPKSPFAKISNNFTHNQSSTNFSSSSMTFGKQSNLKSNNSSNMFGSKNQKHQGKQVENYSKENILPNNQNEESRFNHTSSPHFYDQSMDEIMVLIQEGLKDPYGLGPNPFNSTKKESSIYDDCYDNLNQNDFEFLCGPINYELDTSIPYRKEIQIKIEKSKYVVPSNSRDTFKTASRLNHSYIKNPPNSSVSKFKAETASKFDKINDIYTFAKGSIPKPAMQNPSPKMKEKLEFIEDEKEPRQINSSQIQYPNECSNEISYSISRTQHPKTERKLKLKDRWDEDNTVDSTVLKRRSLFSFGYK